MRRPDLLWIAFVLVLVATLRPSSFAAAGESPEGDQSQRSQPVMTAKEMIQKGHLTPSKLRDLRRMRFESDTPDAARFGRWDTVIPERGGAAIGAVLGMQSVHTMLLPSGKVLMASGSSWRNREPVETYPTFPDPTPGQGLFVRHRDPFREDKLSDYYQLVNNVGIYDPAANSFYRVPHPVPPPDPDRPDHFAPNDFFCTGHLHLPDGNPLFVGGTQYYFPYRTGARTSYIFDWREEMVTDWKEVDWRRVPNPEADVLGYPWTFAGFMERGRWYPYLVPLTDGRFVVFSGFVGFDHGYPEMYRFEINHFVEIFDPSRFEPGDPAAAWTLYDVKDLPDSPFSTPLPEHSFRPTPCVDIEFFDDWGLDTSDVDFTAPCDCPERCRRDLGFDAFKLYPHNYLFPGNRIYLTREGEWVSLRTPDTAYMRRTRFTYWMSLDEGSDPPIRFERGPDRPELVTSYGTSYPDPNTGRITILGGQETSEGTLLPANSDHTSHFAGGRGSRKREEFHPDPGAPGGGRWRLDPDFLGVHPQEDRTMLAAVLLPTRQVLLLNGGNYDFYGPVHYPLLLTPRFDARGNFLEYEKERMNEAIEPRLYHNSALLLPDARVLVAGGNTSRATVTTAPIPPRDPERDGQPLPDLDLVGLDTYFFTDGQIAEGQKGQLTVPTETWVAEIFSPPYLFVDGDRRPTIRGLRAVDPLPAGVTFEGREGGETFYLLHSDHTYEVALDGLPPGPAERGALVLIKLPSFTHGWDSGQRLVDLRILATEDGAGRLRFRTPNARRELIPPAFYMLFYVDARGKPSVAQMVRFDDSAIAP